MENEKKKVSLAGIFLVVAIIVIIVMGCVMYMNYSKIAELTSKINSQENKTEVAEETSGDYISNFSESVEDILGTHNEIVVDISYPSGELSINNKHEAYLQLSDSNFKEYEKRKKVADNVVNAWYCREGQAVGGEYILFLKEDGTVTYERFTFNESEKLVFESEEKVLDGITNISNIIRIVGDDNEGIGGLGVIFVKEDGTCMEFKTLEDLTEENEDKEDIED